MSTCSKLISKTLLLNFNKDFPTGTKFDFITMHFIALKQSYDDCKFAAEFLSKDFYDIEMWQKANTSNTTNNRNTKLVFTGRKTITLRCSHRFLLLVFIR